MDRKVSGQALVEVALALPVLGMGVAVAVLLLVYAHNVICLQLMASKAARRMTVESSSYAPIIIRHPLWGRITVLRQRGSPQPLEPWRPFKGAVRTVEVPGRLVSMQISSRLLPGLGFSRQLPALTQLAAAETLVEPSRPLEE